MDRGTGRPDAQEDVARRAQGIVAEWARQRGLRRAAVRGGERWALPRGTVVAWFYPPAGRWQRGLELNLLHLRTDGREPVAEQIGAALGVLGLDASDHPSVPYAVLAERGDVVVREVLEPYLAAYAELDALAVSGAAS